jgi:cell division septum initiation protein DivIVA
VSEQHEEESLRRWAREQAEIERQTDALVLRTLTAMVTAAEDLKSKLRRDTEAMLEEYRKTKRGLENEISLSTAERQRFRREVEQERDAILSEANEQAREIVDAAKQEREQLLHETREMEQRLRGIESQIRALFGQGAVVQAADDDADGEAADLAARPAFTPATRSRSATPAVPTPDPVAPAPPSAAPAEADEEPAPALVEDEAELVDEEEEPATAAPARPTFTPAPPPPVVAATPDAPAAPSTPTAPATLTPAASTARQRRLVELVFDNVPGYQQASALERAVDDLVPDGEVDILDFERGQLVLNVHAVDLEVLAEQLVATSTAVLLELESIEGDRATFHCN